MTIRKTLIQSINTLNEAGIPNAELDARILVKHVTNFEEAELIKNMNQLIPNRLIRRIDILVARRAQNEPIAYILVNKEFFGFNFMVNKNVLIPRPESEYLVEQSLDYLKNHRSKLKTVLDMGTGSGCIIVSILRQLKEEKSKLTISAFAVDNSAEALKVALQNAKNNGTLNIDFIESNLFSNIDPEAKFDLIIANLPYVPEDGADKSTEFEPKDAIIAADNGTAIIKKFLGEAKDHLKDMDSLILIELDPRNAEELQKFAKKAGYKADLVEDLADKKRYMKVTL
jgi:release factor glutamine methyltransferase